MSDAPDQHEVTLTEAEREALAVAARSTNLWVSDLQMTAIGAEVETILADRDTALRQRVEAAVNDDLTPSLTCWLADTAHEPLPSNPHYASVNPEWLRLLIAEARAIRAALDASHSGTDPTTGAGTTDGGAT